VRKFQLLCRETSQGGGQLESTQFCIDRFWKLVPLIDSVTWNILSLVEFRTNQQAVVKNR
jgi:hypothetical protein